MFTFTKGQPIASGLPVSAGTCQWKPDDPGPNHAKTDIMALASTGPLSVHTSHGAYGEGAPGNEYQWKHQDA